MLLFICAREAPAHRCAVLLAPSHELRCLSNAAACRAANLCRLCRSSFCSGFGGATRFLLARRDHHDHLTPFEFGELLNNDQIRQLDAICLEVTSKLFRVDCAERIIDALKYSRAARKGHYRTAPDFRHFVGIYHWVKAQTPDFGDYVVFRRYLKTLSGVYRWHFASFQHPSVRKSLHETIKIETHCEHCGSVAKVLIDRLIEANLWAV